MTCMYVGTGERCAIATIRRLQDEAYDYLKEKILSGEFSDGQLYSETKATAMLGMSRTPVRDALLRLSMEGLIEIFPSRGFSIKKVSKATIKETIEVRRALEGYAAYMLACAVDTQEAREALFKLNECVNSQEALLLAPKMDVEKFVDLNFTFHNIMIDYLKNDVFQQTYKRYENKIKELTYGRFVSSSEIVREAYKGHIQILALIRSGNTEQVFSRSMTHNDLAYYSQP